MVEEVRNLKVQPGKNYSLLGGLLVGIATLCAGILPHWAAGLLAVGIVLPLLGSSLVSPPFDRIFAVPVVGLALAALFGLLRKIRDLGLPLVEVIQVKP